MSIPLLHDGLPASSAADINAAIAATVPEAISQADARYHQRISSYASLRAVYPVNPAAIYLDGGVSENYGAQGIFIASTVGTTGQYVDNGVTIIVPTGGDGSAAWLRVFDQATYTDYIQGSTGSVSRTVTSRLQEHVSVFDFGADPTGVLDSTAAIQAAINAAETTTQHLFLPAGLYRTTAPIVLTRPLHIHASGCAWSGTAGTVLDADFSGAWFYLNHAGVGFSMTPINGVSNFVSFSGFGTVRDQPTPGAGWSPNANDYDFQSTIGSDVYLTDIMMLNPTKGVQMLNSGGGRLFMTNVKGQPFQVGVDINVAEDVCYLDKIHFLPFWSSDANVWNYCKANLDAFTLGRVDTPNFSNIFTIFARSTFRLYQTASGSCTKIQGTNIKSDRGLVGIWADPTLTTPVSGQFSNFTHAGETGLVGAMALAVDPNNVNARFDFDNFETSSYTNAIRAYGTNTQVRVTNLNIINYDQGSAGFPAIEAGAGCYVYITEFPNIANGVATGPHYGGAGQISSPEWRETTPAPTSGTGTITTANCQFYYKIVGKTLFYEAFVFITTNGTGASYVVVAVPVAATNIPIGCGRDTAISGKALQSMVNGSNMRIYNYDGTYPAVDGSVLSVTGSYEIA